MSRKAMVLLLPIVMGGCSIFDSRMPASPSEHDGNLFFFRYPAYENPALLAAAIKAMDNDQVRDACPPPAGGWQQTGADHLLIRCSYRLARAFAEDRIQSASLRNDELERIEKIGRVGFITGLAGAAGNALFRGARAANLSWAFGAAVGYAAYQSFIPEALRASYSNGAAALSCALDVSDRAWTNFPNRGPQSKALEEIKAAAAAMATAAEAVLKEPEPQGSSLPGTQRAILADLQRRLAGLNATLTSLQSVSGPTLTEAIVRARYEAAMANSLVSTINALSEAINLNIENATPGIDQVKILGAAIASQTRAVVDANDRSADYLRRPGDPQPARTSPVTGSSGTNPAGPVGEAATIAVNTIANTPTQPPAAAEANTESRATQEKINLAVTAAKRLDAALRANDLPDFTVCTARIRLNQDARQQEQRRIGL